MALPIIDNDNVRQQEKTSLADNPHYKKLVEIMRAESASGENGDAREKVGGNLIHILWTRHDQGMNMDELKIPLEITLEESQTPDDLKKLLEVLNITAGELGATPTLEQLIQLLELPEVKSVKLPISVI